MEGVIFLFDGFVLFYTVTIPWERSNVFRSVVPNNESANKKRMQAGRRVHCLSGHGEGRIDY
jgi:hypothetical protein